MRLVGLLCCASVALTGCEAFVGPDLTYAGDTGIDAPIDATIDAPIDAPIDATDSVVTEDTSDSGTIAEDSGTDANVIVPDADAADSTPLDCMGNAGTTPMVRVTTPWGSFCIDVTEATNAQYNAFIDAKVAYDVKVHGCATQTHWTDAVRTAGKADLARDEVTWCDAYAYCQWAGKRLCGHIADGAELSLADEVDMTKSEWGYVCRSGDDSKNSYPYGGDTAIPGTCWDLDSSAEAGADAGPLKPKSYPACHGVGTPFNQVYDLAGNVAEWINSCSDGETGTDVQCGWLGGRWTMYGAANHLCSNKGQWSSTDNIGGIRCCK